MRNRMSINARFAAVVFVIVTAQSAPGGTAPVFEMQDLFKAVRIPNIVVAADGTVLAFARSGRLLRRSADGGRTWGPAREVGRDAAGSAIVDRNTGDVMVVSARGGHLWRSRDWRKQLNSRK